MLWNCKKALQTLVEDNFFEKETHSVKNMANIVCQVRRVQEEGIGLCQLDKEFRK
ncbi:hypothetical protein G9A89_015053 [Geosiphon pyriformis]|nr:hypothetical protein G9A89_015053 [Geosiphon pyriformis]